MPHRIAQIRLVAAHPEVYEPCDDSFALVDALLSDSANILSRNPTLCLEIGSGSGYVITSLALILQEHRPPASHFIATDINPHALAATSQTLAAHGVTSADLVQTDILNGMEDRLTGKVDLLVVNPPYVPTPEDEVGVEGLGSAWAGGENGRSVIDRILVVAERVLAADGWMYLVTLTENKPGEICRIMKGKGFGFRIVVQRSTVEESLHIIKFWRQEAEA
uniref:Methyltransferase small domain-containing protein n=1 Tax=Kalanchoe fedtschenkoi TaxID=63787 RepID=A0A7N0UZ84_KALFE